MQYVVFRVWLLLLGIVWPGFVHPVAWISASNLSMANKPRDTNIAHSVSWVISGWMATFPSACLASVSSSFPLLFLLASLLHSSFLPLFLLFSLRRLWLHTYCVTGIVIKHLIKPPAWCKLKGTMYHFFKWMLHFKTGLDLLISCGDSTEFLSTCHPVSPTVIVLHTRVHSFQRRSQDRYRTVN